jgi:hypothetical protein
MPGQMQEPSEAAGGAGELGRPAGQVGQVAAASSQPRLQLVLEPEQQLASSRVEGQHGRAVLPRRGVEAGRHGVQRIR